MQYANPNTEGAVINFKERYGNFIGGEWKEPVNGEYFDNIPLTTSATSQAVCVRRKAPWVKSTKTPLPTISTNHWVWLARSFRGTSRC
jgi:hypothetical protein